MKKVFRKIIAGAIFFGCVATAVSAGAYIDEKASAEFEEDNTPIIILDAGHGESTKTEFIDNARFSLESAKTVYNHQVLANAGT